MLNMFFGKGGGEIFNFSTSLYIQMGMIILGILIAYSSAWFLINRYSLLFRIKLKYEEYKRLHSIKTGFTEKMVFKLLRDGDYDSINEAMELFDEEQKPFYQSLIDKVESYYNEIKTISLNEYRDDFETDKDAALYIKTCTYPHVLFYMRKGYDYNALIWKYVERKIKE